MVRLKRSFDFSVAANICVSNTKSLINLVSIQPQKNNKVLGTIQTASQTTTY